jgi:GH18 family chitinase
MKCFKLLSSCTLFTAFLIVLMGFGAVAKAQTSTTTTTLPKRLIGDYGYWSRTQTPPYSSDQIPFNKVTHINHAGVSFDANGNLIIPSGFIEKALLTKAHNHGVKVLLLLGGDFTGMETTTGGLAALQQNLQASTSTGNIPQAPKIRLSSMP